MSGDKSVSVGVPLPPWMGLPQASREPSPELTAALRSLADLLSAVGSAPSSFATARGLGEIGEIGEKLRAACSF